MTCNGLTVGGNLQIRLTYSYTSNLQSYQMVIRTCNERERKEPELVFKLPKVIDINDSTGLVFILVDHTIDNLLT